ncbi:MAG: PilN domain-containing protein [Pseudohongiellaceae bacterium]
MRSEISQLDAQVAEISELQQQKEDIQARMNVITDLQGTRPVIVRIFDELVRTLPEGVYYETLERTGDIIAIEGVSESYSRITELMRRLDDSEWFTEADLSDISAADVAQSAISNTLTFTLTLNLELPNQQSAQGV